MHFRRSCRFGRTDGDRKPTRGKNCNRLAQHPNKELRSHATDGSLLASGTRPERDTYTLVGSTSLKRITAIRLDVLTDPSLPTKVQVARTMATCTFSEIEVQINEEAPSFGRARLPTSIKRIGVWNVRSTKTRRRLGASIPKSENHTYCGLRAATGTIHTHPTIKYRSDCINFMEEAI